MSKQTIPVEVNLVAVVCDQCGVSWDYLTTSPHSSLESGDHGLEKIIRTPASTPVCLVFCSETCSANWFNGWRDQ